MGSKEVSPTPEKADSDLTPFRTYNLRPTRVKRESWFSSCRTDTTESKRVLSVYEANDDGSLGLEAELLRYYIDTDAQYHIPIWPLNSSQVVSAFPVDTTPKHILGREALPLEIMQQSHVLGGRFMCTMGGIYEREGMVKDGEKGEAETGTATEAAKETTTPPTYGLSSGLGHGVWSDDGLEKALGLPPGKVGHSIKQGRLEWRAMGDDWYEGPSEWPERGKVNGGGLMLKAGKQLIALYKPRSALWADEKDGGNGKGVGVLAICFEKVDEEAARHVLISAVAIEEQIMRSKGFHPSSYHAHWS